MANLHMILTQTKPMAYGQNLLNKYTWLPLTVEVDLWNKQLFPHRVRRLDLGAGECFRIVFVLAEEVPPWVQLEFPSILLSNITWG